MSDYYISSSLTFHSDKITIDDSGLEVMMSWEDDLMSASAAYVTQNGGDILEIGFGMGISAGYIQSHSISSHTIVENHPQILEKLQTWVSGKSNVVIISQSWADVTGSLSTYDGVFYDTYGDERHHLFSSSLSGLTKSNAKVTFWNNNKNESNDLNIPNCQYQQISITPTSNSYFTGSTIYYMPMKEF
jgi:hypothetical protein